MAGGEGGTRGTEPDREQNLCAGGRPSRATVLRRAGGAGENPSIKSKHIYLLLAIAGLVLPYMQFVPWVLEHGLDMRLFVAQLFASRISAFFGMDVLVPAAVVVVFLWAERSRLGNRLWIPLVALVTVGVSLALPLALYLREDR